MWRSGAKTIGPNNGCKRRHKAKTDSYVKCSVDGVLSVLLIKDHIILTTVVERWERKIVEMMTKKRLDVFLIFAAYVNIVSVKVVYVVCVCDIPAISTHHVV